MTLWAPISRHLWNMMLPPEAVKASQVGVGGALIVHLLICQSPEICSRGQRSLPRTLKFSTAPPSPASTRHWLYPLTSSENVTSAPVCPRSVIRFRHTLTASGLISSFSRATTPTLRRFVSTCWRPQISTLSPSLAWNSPPHHLEGQCSATMMTMRTRRTKLLHEEDTAKASCRSQAASPSETWRDGSELLSSDLMSPEVRSNLNGYSKQMYNSCITV